MVLPRRFQTSRVHAGVWEKVKRVRRSSVRTLQACESPVVQPGLLPPLEAASHLGQPVVELLFLFTRYLSPGFPSGPAGVSLSTVGQPELFWKDVDPLLHVEQFGWKTFHRSLAHSLNRCLHVYCSFNTTSADQEAKLNILHFVPHGCAILKLCFHHP